MKTLSFAAIAILVLGTAAVGLSAVGMDGPKEMRRIECKDITMFTPAHAKSAEHLCKNYGGVASAEGAQSSEGLVILVRNQPMGGFDGYGQAQ